LSILLESAAVRMSCAECTGSCAQVAVRRFQ
jgi:hypothetical protein